MNDKDRDAEDDAHDDPTRVLDGWQPTAGVPAFDPTRVLDGWKPEKARDARKLDAKLPVIEALRPAAAPAAPAMLDDVGLGVATRKSKWNVSDVTDIEAVWKPGSEVSQAARQTSLSGEHPAETITVWRKSDVPRLLAHWQPGCWVGALKRVFGAVSQLLSTPQGPVVDTFAPHLLLALWPPQGLESPLLSRWPQRLLLSAVQPEDAGEELLKHLPADAELWLAEQDIDWALAGQAVLLHEPGLREFQLKELRAFVDAERQATWDRVNTAYRLPGTGQPLERV
jgi:hypothetical protein